MDPTQDLKITILELKRSLAKIRDENLLLKVKIRKLQNEVSKRDRQIETLIDPRKSSLVKKVISERGASMIVTLRERNLNLQKVLAEKDALIKRLQSDLQTKRLYTVKVGDRKKCPRTHDIASDKCIITIPYYDGDLPKDSPKSDRLNCKSVSMYNINHNTDETAKQTLHLQRNPTPSLSRRSLSADRTQFDRVGDVQSFAYVNNDTRAQYEGLSRDHLLSIIGSLKQNQRFSPRIRKGGSPESDLDRNELQCDTPHQEIQQLQNYFMDMLAEVDQLKVTISSLKAEQGKTMDVLKQKDCNIVKLAKEIKNLKGPKPQNESIPLRPKRSASATGQTKAVKKKEHSFKAARPKSVTKMTENTDEPKEEDTSVNICTSTEVESDDEKPSMQVIHTRTMSIQTHNKPAQNTRAEGLREVGKLLSRTHSNCSMESFRDEEEARRQTFSNLLQQMHGNMFSKLIPREEAN